MRHFLTLKDYSSKELLSLIKLGRKIKMTPSKYENKLKGKVLLMLFAKPSLRTRLSFEIGMLGLGGHAIFYDISTSPLGKKESIKDGSAVSTRYVDIVMARLYEHKDIEEFASHSSVPVINGLTNSYHPCQALGDMLTIWEKFRTFNVKLAYLGDANNNVTHSLMYACSKLGVKMQIACPKAKEFMPDARVVKETGVKVVSLKEAVRGADVIYSDSWRSYHIKDSQMKRRLKALKKYQVNSKTFGRKALFMHCLPATRGEEVTDQVMDSPRSVILDQAENREHIEKAIMLKLMRKG
jgi:ornithine carbamoyltransferase